MLVEVKKEVFATTIDVVTPSSTVVETNQNLNIFSTNTSVASPTLASSFIETSPIVQVPITLVVFKIPIIPTIKTIMALIALLIELAIIFDSQALSSVILLNLITEAILPTTVQGHPKLHLMLMNSSLWSFFYDK